MNRWIFLALLGGATYWLLNNEPKRRAGAPASLPDADAPASGDQEPAASEPGAGAEQSALDEALQESFPASDPPAVTPRSPP